MKIVYIAHPIGGDQKGNMMKIAAIYRYIKMTHEDVVPFAPYIADLLLGDDNDPVDRATSFKNNKVLFDLNCFHELWVCGAVSFGVATEINWANEQHIPVKMRTDILELIEKENIPQAPMWP